MSSRNTQPAPAVQPFDFSSFQKLYDNSYGAPQFGGFTPMQTPAPSSLPSSAPNINSNSFDWFGKNGVVTPTVDALSGALQAYTGYKSLQLGEDQFDLSKQQYNRDLSNNSQTYNTLLQNSYGTSLQDSGKYNLDTPEGKAAFQTDLDAYVQNNRVDGSALK